MFPELFRIGGFVVTTFGLMMLLSFLSAAWLLSIQLERFGQRREIAWDVLAGVAIAGIAGAKAYYLALHPQDVIANPIGEIFSRGGLVWYGGLIGGVLAYYFQVRAKRLPVPLMFDATAPALAVAYAVGRMGCFLVGDDYGAYTDTRVGIAFPKGSPPSTAGYLRYLGEEVPAHIPDAQVVTVHPTQLYEIVLALIMFAILWRLARRPLRQGQLFAAWMVLYAILRFGIEFVRAKGDRIAFGLSTSQVASIILLAVGATLWILRRNAAALPTAATAPVPTPGPRAAPAKRRG
jgi:phosphatidylglycerol:prolipoprotein diacylglycerol transferase